MKSIKFLFALIALIMSFSNCTENDPDVVAPEEEEGIPEATPVGTVMGAMVTNDIGPEGGSVTSIDGKMQLMIPAGALNATTPISVQPISNFAPGGVDNAYELLPDGQTFSKPVTLIFHYMDSVQSTPWPEMDVAFQDTDGFWHGADNIVSDSVSKTVTATSLHFTPFALYRSFLVWPAFRDVPVKKSLDLTLMFIGKTTKGLLTLGSKPVTIWKVNGITNGNSSVGRISITGDMPPTATYTAPDKAPSKEIVKVNPVIPGMKGSSKIRGGYIRIVETEFHYKLEIHGQNGFAGGAVSSLENKIYDSARLNIDVVDGVVTISNIKNSPATPQIVNGKIGDCDGSVNAGLIGGINIEKASGTIFADNILVLSFEHKDIKSSWFSLKCPKVDATITLPRTVPGFPLREEFLLQKTIQIKGVYRGKYFARLAPRN